jgi:glycosyltransferase involved in cell wall biosynthesis
MTIAFASSMASVPWGGSEILWSETAALLAQLGHCIAVATPAWPARPSALHQLASAGDVQLSTQPRSRPASLKQRLVSKLFARPPASFERCWLRQCQPALLCISNGNSFEGVHWMEAAHAEGIPFVTISQAHAEFLAPDDQEALRLIAAFRSARTNYFVCKANQHMVETQLGWQFHNACLIGNHSRHLPTAAPLPWPESTDATLQLACVARLHPPSKGQDLVFQALADPRWQSRPWRLSLFGSGDQEQCLRRLASQLGIADRVDFRGQTDTPLAIWQRHHALILASRYEGLPLVLMEAMLAGRPVISTAVAGAPELVQHGVSGFLAEAPTSQHLLACLEQAWDARHRWSSMGLAAHRHASSRAAQPPAERLASELQELLS